MVQEEGLCMSKNKNVNDILVVALKLFAICVVVATVVSVVNHYTSRVIENNKTKKMNEQLHNIMPGDYEYNEISAVNADAVIYEALAEDTTQGYCVKVTVNGYSGPITMIVGFSTSCSVTAVEIVSSSETPGIGTKVLESSFLNGFKGYSEPIEFSKDNTGVDALTGATITSNSVKDGINKALSALLEVVRRGEQK
jgi:electron transport complex protein RnfG